MTQVHEPSVKAAEDTPLPARERRLLVGAGLPPLAWGLHLTLAYGLVYPSLRLKTKFALVAVTVACFALALVGAWLAFAARHVAPDEADDGAPGSAARGPRELARPADHARTRQERVSFVAAGATVLGFFFAAVILAQAVPIAVFAPEDP